LAGNAVGGCTQSYRMYSVQAMVSGAVLANDPLAAQVAPIVDKNGDGNVCYKPYPNGVHNNGAGGNFTDNTSGPHS
jgi:hypothetical protein